MSVMMSLRSRITLIILVPLFLVAGVVGYWAFHNTQLRAETRFDESLLATATAISQDVIRSEGDALSVATRDLLDNTSGGRVYYHVYAPDGVFVTGYATPPVAPRNTGNERMQRYNAIYHGSSVRVLRLREHMQIDGLLGDFNFTVWQDTSVRDAFITDHARQTFIVIAILTASVGLIVWVGVRVGLRPLVDLQNAIAMRSSIDLTPIKRPVPVEARGIVATLNHLLQQVNDSMLAKNEFISNAAHQLRNPVAGVMAMAEAVMSAPDAKSAVARTADLYEAAQEASDLANKLLSFERANRADNEIIRERVDLVLVARSVVQLSARRAASVQISFTTLESELPVIGDPIMIREAIANLVENALLHGGISMSQIRVRVSRSHANARVTVTDNGVGLTPDQQAIALERFGQVNPGVGSGLGLSIVQSVAGNHAGTFNFERVDCQLCAVLTLSLSDATIG